MAITDNKNFLSPIGFNLNISREKLGSVEYFCVSANLPDVSVPEIATPFRMDYGYAPGEKLEYAPLTVSFLVDEDMVNYKELYNWMKENAREIGESTVDATLSILTSHGNVGQQIRFVECFPTSLSSLDFNSQNSDVEYFTAQTTLRYNYYEFL